MLRLAANISFLFKELPFLDRFAAAKAAGFDIVECHWPYEHNIGALREQIERAGVTLVMLNTAPGKPGEFGLGALPGREAEFKAAIDQALAYATDLGATRIHCMAGTMPVTSTAHRTFVDNLRRAADIAADRAGDVVLLIEPINIRSAPGYFLTTTQQAADLIAEIDRSNVRLMFDVFHVQIMEGDIIMRLEKLMPIIGHVQIAAVPSRAEPDEGEVNYRAVFDALERLGYSGIIGCEYQPRGATMEGMSWRTTLRV